MGQDALARWQRVAAGMLGGFLDDAGVQTAVADLRALQTNGTLTRLSGDKLAQTIGDFLAVWTQLEQAAGGGRPGRDAGAGCPRPGKR